MRGRGRKGRPRLWLAASTGGRCGNLRPRCASECIKNCFSVSHTLDKAGYSKHASFKIVLLKHTALHYYLSRLLLCRSCPAGAAEQAGTERRSPVVCGAADLGTCILKKSTILAARVSTSLQGLLLYSDLCSSCRTAIWLQSWSVVLSRKPMS